METKTKNQKISESMKGNTNSNINMKRGMFTSQLQRSVLANPQKLEKIIDKLLEEAENGEAWAVKELSDRLDGKAIAGVELSGPEGNPIEATHAVNFSQSIVEELLKSRQKASK